MFVLFALLLFVYSQDELPGAQILNVGFDYRNGSFSNYEEIIKAMPIFEYSYDQGKTFSPPTHSTYKWTVPDDVYVMSKPISQYNDYAGMGYDFSFVQKTSLTSWHISGGFSYDGFGVNANYSTEMGKLQAWCKYKLWDIVLSNILYTIYYAEPTSYLFMTLSGNFQAFVDHMPRQIQSEMDKKILNEFILKYGTHFAEDGHFGGAFHFDAHLNVNYVNHTSTSFVSHQFSLNFLYQTWGLTLGGGLFTNKSQIHISQDFLQQSTSEMFFTGGNLDYQTNTTLEQWKDSLYQIQAMTNGTLTPLWELFDDDQKAAVVKKAITEYVKNGVVTVKNIDHGMYALACGYDGVTARSSQRIFEDGKVKKVEENEVERDMTVDTHLDLQSYMSNAHKAKVMSERIPIHTRETYEFVRKQKKENKKMTICSKKVKINAMERMEFNTTDEFQSAVDALPVEYDEKAYRTFIRSFGTTYVRKVHMGGEFKINVYTDANTKESEIKEMCSKVIEVAGVKSSNFDVKTLGGLSDEFKSWEHFVEEVKKNPAPIAYEVATISDLVGDADKKANVEKAIDEYEAVSYLKMKKILEEM